MGTYEEYLQKSNELFGIIGGKFSVGEAQKAALRREFEELLYETASRDGYSVGTSKNRCDPVSCGYAIAIEKRSFKESETAKIREDYEKVHVALKDTGDHYIGNLVSAKSKRRFAIISNDQESMRAIDLMNELFYKTPPVIKGSAHFSRQSAQPNGRLPGRTVPPVTKGKTVARKTAGFGDLPTSSWDTLD